MFIKKINVKNIDELHNFLQLSQEASFLIFHYNFYNNCKNLMAFLIKLFCSRHKSRVISVEETTQRYKKKGLDSKCTNCGNKLVTICHLIAHVR